MNKIKYVLIILLAIFLVSACHAKRENPVVTMSIKDYGEIEIELYPDIAPNTVANFVNLVEDGFYNNNTIHRLAKGFVLQGGDPTASGTGGPGYTIKGEFKLNGYNNNLSHKTGIISMARNSTNYDSAGSQFFIVLSDDVTASLDGGYAAFGKVTKGMDVIKQIESAGLEVVNEKTGQLKTPLTIESATVDTKGVTYKVEKIESK